MEKKISSYSLVYIVHYSLLKSHFTYNLQFKPFFSFYVQRMTTFTQNITYSNISAQLLHFTVPSVWTTNPVNTWYKT